MQFCFTEDQRLLQEGLADFLADRYDHAARNAIVSSDSGWSPDVWRSLADLGVLGLTFDDADGGLGGGGVEQLLVMESVGAALLVEPYFQTCVVGGALLRRSASPRAESLRKGIVAGNVRLAVAWQEPQARFAPMAPSTIAKKTQGGFMIEGVKAVVACASMATHILVTARMKNTSDGMAVFAVDPNASGIERRDYATIDGSRASEIRFSAVKVDHDAVLICSLNADSAIAAMLGEAIAALCGESVGIMKRALMDTLRHTHHRRQFGAALADFQSLQHRMADMATATATAEAMAFHAAGMIASPTGRDQAMSAAKLFVGEALRFVTQNAVQLHGAMGVTDELPIGHLFRRATVIESEFGTTAYHLRRLTEAGSDLRIT
jgi:alkylation response protein AidB-like acyl-CoA dehydrogenase